jgi:prepilin-type N-terminal cleavage/methylation domain-containing protein
LAALAAAVVLFFWNNTPDNAPWYMKRMDFGRPSAQHRVAAWKAGFEMMRDYPLGVGWNNAVGVYDRNYSPPEGGAAALTMNDYLMLGTQLGLPGLVCFVAYVGLALTRKSEIGNRKSESTEESAREDARPTSAQISSLVTCHLPLQTACRAGAIMLLVAFWFDGGLFTLATASVFWILLELGAEVGTSRCDVRTAQRAVPTNNECGVRSARQNSEFRTPNSEVSSAGFTLIELLVVIGIIGILAALIMAATVRAKDQGARAVDINNLKQMTIALHLYAGDNQDYLPWSNWLKGDQPDRHGWLYTPSDNLAVLPPGESPFKVETGIFWPTLRNPKLYFCPADGPNTPLFSQRAQQISSYVMNGAVNGYTRILYPTTKLGQMPPTGVVFWETDETKPGYFNDGASQPKEGVSKRHDKGAINATFSGSVGYISFVNWYQQADSTNKNDLWCYPGSPDGH